MVVWSWFDAFWVDSWPPRDTPWGSGGYRPFRTYLPPAQVPSKGNTPGGRPEESLKKSTPQEILFVPPTMYPSGDRSEGIYWATPRMDKCMLPSPGDGPTMQRQLVLLVEAAAVDQDEMGEMMRMMS